MKFIRAVFSQHRRNSNIKIMNLLACPTCMSNDLVMQGKKIKCKTCEQFYPINKGIPVMFSKDAIDNSTSSRGEY